MCGECLFVYNMPTVVSRRHLLGADSMYRLHTAITMCTGKRRYWTPQSP